MKRKVKSSATETLATSQEVRIANIFQSEKYLVGKLRRQNEVVYLRRVRLGGAITKYTESV